MAVAAEFMKHPLTVWVAAFKDDGKQMDFNDLADGVFLNDIMLQIDPRPTNIRVNREVNGDVNLRIQNLDTVMRNIKSYYQDILQQLIVMSLPNILAIAKEPDSETSVRELHKLLLLMLGCAVQCERKEVFIEKIKQLDIDVQHAIVGHIQEITDNTGNVFCMQWSELTEIPLEQLDALARNMFEHLKRVVKERDDYAEVITDLSQEREYLQSQVDVNSMPISPPVTPDKDKQHHINVELSDTKAKLRRMRQELEEKTEQGMELKEELEQANALLQKVKQDNIDLTQDARAARGYRDELDVLKEKASKVDKYEGEIQRYREKLNEMEYLKKRMEELREDNQLLHDTKTLLEEQLESSHRKVERMVQLEADTLKYKQHISELEEERDGDRERIRELVDENTYLRIEGKESMNDSANLSKELDIVKKLTSPVGHSLSTEYGDAASTQILRLEKDNQRLQHELEMLKETTLAENNNKILELEKENQRLSKKVEKLHTASTKDTKCYVELEQRFNELRRDKAKVDLSVDSLSKSVDRQRREYEAETEQLTQTIEILRQRNQKNADQRTKDIEKENKKLHGTAREATNKLSTLEYEHRQLSKNYERLKEKADKIEELEKINRESEEEIEKLQSKIAAITLTCEKVDALEQENSDLDVEKRKLEKTVDTYKGMITKMDNTQSENITLQAEVQKLQRSIETMKSHTTRLSQVEQEKDDLDRQNRQLQKSLHAFQANQERYTKLEVDNMELENANQRLQKSLELANRKVASLERDIQELEHENEKLQREIETLKLSSKKIEELSRDNKDMELDYAHLEKDMKHMEKENKRLKQSMEMKDCSLEDANVKVTNLERDAKRLQRLLEKNKDSNERLKDIEKENNQLMQQATIDKKTLFALREDLVKEKIKTQQISNELEKLSTELHKIGLNKEKMLHQELTEDEDRYKALENRMDDALKKSLEVKEEKIQALETRLQESVSRNQKLNEELRNLKRDLVTLQQRHEEEQVTSTTPSPPKIVRSDSERVSAKEILKMKDHLIELERNNASLQTETSSLRNQNDHLQGQISTLQSQNTSLQSQVTKLHTQNSDLQSQKANLQVENTTLNSEISSLKSEVISLRNKNADLEAELERLRARLDELEGRHKNLIKDQEQLQRLHDNLTQEYEALISEHGSLKSIHKSMKVEYDSLKLKQDTVIKERKMVNDERVSLKAEKQLLLQSGADPSSIQLEFNSLKQMHERLNREYKDIEHENRSLKSDTRQLSLEKASLLGEVTDYKQQCQQLELEIAKISNRTETFQQLNAKLEEENEHLMEQVTKLLDKNAELHKFTIESKDQYHEEEKQFFDKINDLRRQKEKLEQKIMEQYKTYTSPPRRHSRGFKLNLMKKIQKATRKGKDPNLSKSKSSGLDIIDGSEKSDTSSQGSYPESNEGADTSALIYRPGEPRTSADDLDVGGVVRRRNKKRDPIIMTDYRKSLPALAMSDSSLLPPYSVNSSLSSEDLRADAESLSSQGSLDRQHSGGHRHVHERKNSYEKALTEKASKTSKDRCKEKEKDSVNEKDENTASDDDPTMQQSSAVTEDYSYNQTNLSASRSKSGSTDMLPDKPKKEKSGLLSRFKSRSRELLDDSPKHQTVSPQTSQVVSLEEFLEESRYRESTDTDCGPVFEGPPDDTGRMPSKNSDMDGQNDLSRDRSPTQQSHLTSSFKSDTSQQSEFVVNISGANYTSTPTSSRSEYPAGRSDSLRSLKRMAPPPPPPPSNQQRSTGPSPAGRSRQPIGGNIPIMKDNSPRDYSAPTNRTTYDRPKNLAGDVGRYRNGTDSPNDMYSSTQSPTGSTRDRRQAPTTAPMATPSPQNSNIARPRPRPPNRPNDEQPSPGGAAPAGGSGAAGPREGMTKEQSVWYEYGCV